MVFLEELIAENNNGKTNWTQGRLHKSVAAIFGVLHVAPRGLPRIELRNAARAFVGDTGLLDYTIKVLVNKVLLQSSDRRGSRERQLFFVFRVEEFHIRI